VGGATVDQMEVDHKAYRVEQAVFLYSPQLVAREESVKLEIIRTHFNCSCGCRFLEHSVYMALMNTCSKPELLMCG